jgi:maleylacetate reductase
VVLPHAMAYNAPAVPEARARLTRCLSSDDPAGALWDLARCIGAPTALGELGFSSRDAAKAAALVVSAVPANPRPVDEEEVHRLLLAAHEGLRPTPPEEGN